MKAVKNLVVVTVLSLSLFNAGSAQNANRQAYHIHEDRVLPSMVMEYENVAREFHDNAVKYNLPGARWVVTQTNDLRYLYVMPIDNMAALDDNKFWNALSDKMGGDNMKDMFGRMNKCYDVHCDYILLLDKDLTYMPGGITQTPAGEDYRRFYYLYATPGNMENLTKSMKVVKDLFAKKNSTMEYRVYRSGFGTTEAFYMVAIAAKDGLNFESMDESNNKLLGDDGMKAFGEMMKYVSRFEEVTGKMRPDLAYSPK